jgi:quaternary ammonium compound-resistance protein SugE
MAWVYLFLAAALEVIMGLSLKFNEGWTRPGPSGLAVAAALGSIYLLALALRSLPVGAAYAIWTGIGTVGLILVGATVFGEAVSGSRVLFLALTIGGIVGLRFSEAA